MNVYHLVKHSLAVAAGTAYAVFGGTLLYAACVEMPLSLSFRVIWAVMGAFFAVTGILRILGMERIADRVCPTGDRGWVSIVLGLVLLGFVLFRGSNLSHPFVDFVWLVPSLAIGLMLEGISKCVSHDDGINSRRIE